MAAFKVRVARTTMIKASTLSDNPSILPVSNLDLLPGRAPVALVFLYPKPPTGCSFDSVATIKNLLPEFLDHFFPFAGRIRENPGTGRPEILCSNEGAELVEAEADTSLFDIDIKKSLDVMMIPFARDVPLCLQVVMFKCGGFSLSWICSHMLVDGYSLSRLWSSWRELVRTRKISKAPNFDRSLFLPRSPRRFNPTVDCAYTACTPDGLVNVLTGSFLQRGLYFVTASDLDRLQALSRQGGRRATRLESFSAHIWKVLARAVGESDTACKMGWFVDGRSRTGPANAGAMERYIGNATSVVAKEASVKDLRAGALSVVAGMVADAIKQVANEDHFLDLVNWIQLHEKDSMLHKDCIGLGSPGIFIAPCHHLSMESDFGFGEALFGVFHTPGSGRFANGFMRLHASTREGDGSWIVNAVLWPQVATALQSDPICALTPVTMEYLRGGRYQGFNSRL